MKRYDLRVVILRQHCTHDGARADNSQKKIAGLRLIF
jgi:hypothetical protein